MGGGYDNLNAVVLTLSLIQTKPFLSFFLFLKSMYYQSPLFEYHLLNIQLIPFKVYPKSVVTPLIYLW